MNTTELVLHQNAAPVFQFEGNDVRVEIDDAGNPWFNARDVGRCLDLGKQAVSRAVSSLEPDETKSISNGLAGGRPSTYLAESGVFYVILQSRKPAAVRFQKWLRKDVLPQIARTGSYFPDRPTLQHFRQLLELAEEKDRLRIAAERKARAAENQVKQLQPDADFARRLARVKENVGVRQACRWLELNEPATVAWAIAASFFYRDGDGKLVGHSKFRAKGMVSNKPFHVKYTENGEKRSRLVNEVSITPQGLRWLHDNAPAHLRLQPSKPKRRPQTRSQAQMSEAQMSLRASS
jgi:prophage antirepressor-like protein